MKEIKKEKKFITFGKNTLSFNHNTLYGYGHLTFIETIGNKNLIVQKGIFEGGHKILGIRFLYKIFLLFKMLKTKDFIFVDLNKNIKNKIINNNAKKRYSIK